MTMMLAFGLIFLTFITLSGADIGVNYGMVADNLPPSNQVVDLMKSKGLWNVRIFDPNQGALQAMDYSGLTIILGVLNQDIPNLANDPNFASQWVQNNIIPHDQLITIHIICVGNEIIPSDIAQHVLPAMQNMVSALAALGQPPIKVTIAVAMSVLGQSSAPSQGHFSDEAAPFMIPIVKFLSANRFPLLVNIYPYFAYVAQPEIGLDFTIGNGAAVVHDGDLQYTGLFDAMVDSVYTAMEVAGVPDVDIVVSETGWPSGGGAAASVENAAAYNNIILNHARSAGTPKRPAKLLNIFLFALFNEDLKATGVEQNWGLFYPDMREVYHINF